MRNEKIGLSNARLNEVSAARRSHPRFEKTLVARAILRCVAEWEGPKPDAKPLKGRRVTTVTVAVSQQSPDMVPLRFEE
ncbi:hypothetical protein HPB47_002256 [Ixodes persulcatus]|uniref:Uncharacterized protein n=1 Tax=Ixodes persulcatus TaxID=34615 RepID=A0AC60PMX3_IXOPE|nr:hypothetical protein HPB47_002256 [Ixodes persulcatus]